MKGIFLFTFLFSSFAAAECAFQGRLYPAGTSTTFFYSSESKLIGPSYTCGELARVRLCEASGSWSDRQPVCLQLDSGGCVDRWLDQLSDKHFSFESCF